MFSPDQLSLQGFLAFAQSKPADEQYEYTFPSGCAFAQYVESVAPNCTEVYVCKIEISVYFGREEHMFWSEEFPIIRQLDSLAQAEPSKQTFGALAERIQEQLG